MDGDAVLTGAERTQIGVEHVPLTIGPETAAGHAVRPRRQKRNAIQSPSALALENAYVGRRKIQDVLAVHLHLIGAVADRGHDRYLDAARGVREAHDFN